MNIRKALQASAFGLTLIVLATGAAGAQCTTGLFYADLKANFATQFIPGVVDLISPLIASTAQGCAGWQEGVVRIRIPNNCTAAIVLAEYEGLPQGYTLNLGDSPTNDAHGGDGGSTANDAELWVHQENMSVANGSGIASSPTLDNPLISQHLALTDSALKLVVKHQYLSWGQPFGFLQTPSSQNLFAIPDPDPAVAQADKRAIYLGMNRVIQDNSRNGCGLRRVLVKFQ
ncbi:MAG TPA: hypothetical protein VEL74_13845 [Thermoanaerobaculia bacterium]|nr:hypothetical protein [Thermoanaerobaculia bacterium]